MRTFASTAPGSRSFWNVELTGKSFTVTSGSMGTKGKSQTKDFADEDAARREFDKAVAKKIAAGFVETTMPPPGATQRGLEAALIEDPDDLASHRAYADYLSEQADPHLSARGEFIRVQLALEDPDTPSARRASLQQREKDLFAGHFRAWLGDLAPDVSNDGTLDQTGFRLARGWLSAAVVADLDLQTARLLNGCPLAPLLRELTIREPLDFEHQNLAGACYAGNLRSLQLGQPLEALWGVEAIAPAIAAMRRLEELFLYSGGVDLDPVFALDLPRLRTLVVHRQGDFSLGALANNPSMSRLERLEIWPHAWRGHYDGEDEDEGGGGGSYLPLAGIAALVRSPHLTGLRRLSLRMSNAGDAGVAEIIDSGALARLKSLELIHGTITDRGARALADCPAVRHLEWLDLSGNWLTGAGVAALTGLGINVAVGEQRAEGDATYLSESDFE
jgi:uncharacterized protein (TIGR02996 family)